MGRGDCGNFLGSNEKLRKLGLPWTAFCAFSRGEK